MGFLTLGGSDRRLVQDQLLSSYDVRELDSLVQDQVPDVHNEVAFQGAAPSHAVREVVDAANRRGLLDRLLVAAASNRPFRPDLRALTLHFSRQPGWNAALEAHGMAIGASLESLTSPADPFVGTTRLARWLIRAERQTCQVRCGAEHGTGFLVAPDLVLTCYHVVQQHLVGAMVAASVQVRFDYRTDALGNEPPYEAGAWLDIDPDWTIPHARYSQADITLQGEPALDELDYALLRLRLRVGTEVPKDEPEPRGWVDLSVDPSLPRPESPILIVQHPGRDVPPPPQMPLQIAFATPGFEGPNGNGTRVAHKVSTKPGSSGSAIYNRQLRAVALHHNRGQINPRAEGLTLNNRGIPLARIRAALPDAARAALEPWPGA